MQHILSVVQYLPHFNDFSDKLTTEYLLCESLSRSTLYMRLRYEQNSITSLSKMEIASQPFSKMFRIVHLQTLQTFFHRGTHGSVRSH